MRAARRIVRRVERPGGKRAARAALACLLASGVGAAAAPDFAQEGPPTPVTQPAVKSVPLAQSWAELADRNPTVREAARFRLMNLNSDDLPTFRKIVADSAPVLPAQAAVLREIVTQVYLQGKTYPSDPRSGFLGVRLGQVNIAVRPAEQGQPAVELPVDLPARLLDASTVYGVVILERMPGFAGARALQDGDIVLGLIERGIQFQSIESFRQAVLVYGAGQTVHFQILRQGRVVKVPVTLDARPEDADFLPGGPPPLQKLLDEREEAAKAYWEKEFAPLLKEGVG